MNSEKAPRLFYSPDGNLSSEYAKELVEPHDRISVFGGCLDQCHFRTYRSLVDVFRESQKDALAIRFALDGIFSDYFSSIDVTFNLNEILSFNGNEGKNEAREMAILDMFEKYTDYLEITGIGFNFMYNGRLIFKTKAQAASQWI